jgi:hypothetical protein
MFRRLSKTKLSYDKKGEFMQGTVHLFIEKLNNFVGNYKQAHKFYGHDLQMI